MGWLKSILSRFGLTSKKLVEAHLTSNGLASPKALFSSLTFVWILSTSVTPQPVGVIGVWDDTDTWDDLAVWYD